MPSSPKTSLTHPLQIAEIAAPGGGSVGVTFCPGKHQQSAFSGAWARDVAIDVSAIRDWGAGVVTTLVTQAELEALSVADLGAVVKAHGLTWLHLPIRDVSIPTSAWEAQWTAVRAGIHDELDKGGKVLVHCKGGLGRAGTIAARILVERGMAAAGAIKAVRDVRPGALETLEQEDYVHALAETAQAAHGRPGAPR